MRTDRRTAAQIRCFGVKFRIENGLFGNVVFPEGKDTIAHEDCEQKWAQRMISLPWSITGVTDRKPGMEGFYYEKYFVVLMFSGLMAELILWQARGIMHNVNVGRPFCRDTVRRLRTIGTECLVLAVAYFVGMFFVTKFFMVLIFVAFSVIGLILFVFAELFRQAIIYKEENEMTI